MSNMKAVRIHSYGGSEVLKYEDVPRPVPEEGEMLIRVHATSINPFDVAVRSGYVVNYFNHTLPLILGTDVSGVVEEMGPNTNTFSPGDAVYTRAGVYRDGAYAEYVVAAAADVTKKPSSLDHIHAAALPHVTLAAWEALFVQSNLSEGQTVLIHGAAGGVGHIAVQLAKWRGANVICTASDNIDLFDRLDVDEAINYSKTAFEDVVKNVDLVLDTIGGDTLERSWSTLKSGGTLVSLLEQPSAETSEAYGVKSSMVVSNPPIAETLDKVSQLVDEGEIKPIVSSVLSLNEVKKAHQMIETKHTRGKIVLNVAE